MIKDTNPDHYKVDGANFIEYMNDPKISGFGNWMFANGFNSGVWASSNWIKVCDQLPNMNGDYLAVTSLFGRHRIQILTFVQDLEGLDPNEFRGKRQPGFVDYDSEFGFSEWKVSHWMPLPEIPKEDTE